MAAMESAEAIIAELARVYDAAVARLRGDIQAYADRGTVPPPERRRDGSYCYPELRVHYAGDEHPADVAHAFGRLTTFGTYSCTITRPMLYADYLAEQLRLLQAGY